MNSFTKMATALISTLMIFTSSAYSVTIDNFYGNNTSLAVDVSIPKHNKLHFIGSVEGKKANRMATIFIMKPTKTLDDAVNGANIEYMNTVSVDFDGNFEFELNFEKPSETYPIYVVCDGQTYTHNYIFKSWDDIKTMFSKIVDESITYDYIKDYADVLGLDLKMISIDGYKETFVTRLKAKKNEVVADSEASITLIKTVLADANKEFELLNGVKNASNWSELPYIISNVATHNGLTFDYKGLSQQAVCNQLINKQFVSAEELQTYFDAAVVAVASSITSGGGSSGGSSGGGGGYGGVTGGGGSGIFNITPVAPNSQTDTSNAFSDLEQVPWAIKAINYLYTKGVIHGTGNNEFSPNANIRREEIAKIVVDAFGLTAENATVNFEDVTSGAWYYNAVACAKANNIVSGVSDTKFGVGLNVTRQDMSVMIYKAAVASGMAFTAKKTDFTDYDTIAEYAREAVECLAGAGIINGMDDGSFAPTAQATRAQAAIMIYTALSK